MKNSSVENYTLLVVDDSEPFRIALLAILKDAAYNDIKLFDSARAVFDYLYSLDMKERSRAIGLILMDIQMPEMNGIEAVKKMKADSTLADIPIIIVSVNDQDQQIEESFAAGAVDYVEKPVKKFELRARVRSVLRLKEEQDKRKVKEQELLLANKELEKMNKKLHALSITDELTTLNNRRYFNYVFEREWKYCNRDKKPISLIMIDIDYFKYYNDHYGHTAGDKVLSAVASVIRDSLKRPADMCARYGGEEFVVLLPNTDLFGAESVAEAIQDGILKKNIEHGRSKVSDILTLSMGVAAIMPESSGRPIDLVNEADSLLYKAKENGRNRIELDL